MRFPAAGRGVMQVADLDRPNPRFQNTTRSVRPSEVDPIIRYAPNHPAGGYGAGTYGSGFGYGSGAYGGGYGSTGDRYTSSYPYVWGYSPPQPRSVLIESKTIANPPLEPATLLLANGGPREVLVTIVDLKTKTSQQRRIRPSEQVEITVARDAGGKRLQRYQSVTLAGDSVVKEIVSEIRPAVRYELVVHEWVMQSIAIDRTGKSPSVIEDVNFQGKGLGRFTLPPGDELQGGTLDVYQAAISVANRGSIAPITAQEKAIGNGLSPLERAVQDLQRSR